MRAHFALPVLLAAVVAAGCQPIAESSTAPRATPPATDAPTSPPPTLPGGGVQRLASVAEPAPTPSDPGAISCPGDRSATSPPSTSPAPSPGSDAVDCVTVPQVAGQMIHVARAMIEEAGLGAVNAANCAGGLGSIADGTSPVAGTSLRRGTRIWLINACASPFPSPPWEQGLMPDDLNASPAPTPAPPPMSAQPSSPGEPGPSPFPEISETPATTAPAPPAPPATSVPPEAQSTPVGK